MTGSTHPPGQWVPDSEAERTLVLNELESMLSSYHFQSSKRYPAMLKYIVDATLDGRCGDLKERTLGVEVFGRDPNYDTSADPVVRLSASEVRKRIAQYYHENGSGSRVQIELPLGSYKPEFLMLRPETPEAQPEPAPERLISTGNQARAGRNRFVIGTLSATALLAVAAVFGTYAYTRASAARDTVIDKFWGPLLHSPDSVLIVVGTSDFVPPNIKPVDADKTDHLRGPYHHVSMSSALALARVAGFLQAAGKTYQIKDDREVSLTDFRSRPVILIGALSNSWTLRLTDPLRFRFDFGSLARIQDRKNPKSNEWSDPNNILSDPHYYEHSNSSNCDYALIARYHDTTTNGPVMVIAGIGAYGTEAASEFAVSPQYINQLLSKAPADWEDMNLEIVIRADKINGEAGPPYLVSYTYW